ncbi:MAG: division/cell wall cluster transcriptional repressor MraZ [Actinomycetota bacterium]|jgi:MraZ protein|nr:division/cell wall cluster transcriptional repressor MraZ [Actinomycetota bacterium]
MFLGEYQRNLDSKQRLFIPAKFREELNKGIAVISKGFDEKCLFLFSIENWEELAKKITTGPVTNINIQKFSRWFFKSAHEEVLDSQGRIKIDKTLADYANIKKDVVLVGVSTRAEIWSKEMWENYADSAEKEFSGNEKAFESLGF